MDACEPELAARSGSRDSYRWESTPAILWQLQTETFAELAASAYKGRVDLDRSTRALDRAHAVLAGLERYQHAPFHRSMPAVPIIWRRGASCLFDFGGNGPVVLVVPSLINRAWILDLSPELSRMRALARSGFRVLLIDWGVPGGCERDFGVASYVDDRLRPALAVAKRLSGARCHMIGYCMGGLLALAAAASEPETIDRIATIGTPWDFSAFPEHPTFRKRRPSFEDGLRRVARLFGVIPPGVIQSFFTMRDLPSSLRKFERFRDQAMETQAARNFIAIEDWLNIGAPLTLPVALECFGNWLADNALHRGEWNFRGVRFDPRQVRRPTLVVSGRHDKVVPPASSEPLAAALPAAPLLSTETGHLSAVLGPVADREVWRHVHDFFRND